jgi:hypothetical protein
MLMLIVQKSGVECGVILAGSPFFIKNLKIAKKGAIYRSTDKNIFPQSHHRFQTPPHKKIQ